MTKHRILQVGLLEDDEIQARTLKQWMAELGHECAIFPTASEFQHSFRKSSFDAVLLDWNLPDQSGLEVLSWLRETVVTDVPVVSLHPNGATRLRVNGATQNGHILPLRSCDYYPV